MEGNFKPMKSDNIAILILTGLILVNCAGSTLKEREKEGYQIFPEYGIGIKVPCVLQIDSTVTTPTGIGIVKTFVCPQIFNDTSRTTFDIFKLLANESYIYHLKIWDSQTNPDISQSLLEQRNILNEFNIENCEKLTVSGNEALMYGPIKTYTWEAFIPLKSFTVYVAVTGDKTKLEEILSDMIIEE